MHTHRAWLSALAGLTLLAGCSSSAKQARLSADGTTSTTAESTTTTTAPTTTTAAPTTTTAAPTTAASTNTTARPAPTSTTVKRTTTTTAKPATTTTAARTFTVSPASGSGSNPQYRASGTGCFGDQAGIALYVYDPAGQMIDGNGGAAMPDGTWSMPMSFPSYGKAPGKYKLVATCHNTSSSFTYAPQYYTYNG